jgi:hypothetical protein
MPFPETIPVKYSEEEAEFISMRPLVRQTFRPAELVDMIVAVTGKDPQRVQQILRSGTIVFHSYRYWWRGFDAEPDKLAEILEKYPDANPSRPFRPEDCTEAILESGAGSAPDPMLQGSAPRHSFRLRREDASRKRLFRSRSLWDALMDLTRPAPPAYREYSYALRADIYFLQPDAAQLARLAREAAQYSARALRPHLALLPSISQIVFVCPRPVPDGAGPRSS